MIFCILQTKGGVGKSFIAQQIIAPYCAEQNQDGTILIEVDSSNESNNTSKNSELFEYYRSEMGNLIVSKDTDSAIQDISTALTRAEILNKNIIFDVGAGMEGKFLISIIETIKTGFTKDVVFVVPMLDDIDSLKNTQEILSLIRELSNDSKVLLLVNKYKELPLIIGNEKDITCDLKKDSQIENFIKKIKQADKAITNKDLIEYSVLMDFGLNAKDNKKSITLYEIGASSEEYSKELIEKKIELKKEAKRKKEEIRKSKNANKDELRKIDDELIENIVELDKKYSSKVRLAELFYKMLRSVIFKDIDRLIKEK